MKNKAYKIALGGIISSLCLLAMFMSGVFPAFSMVLPMISGILMMIIVVEINTDWAFLTYISVSLLALIMTFDKESALLFIMFFGHYPIIRFEIDKIKLKIVRAVLKLIIFNVCAIAFFYLTTYVMGLTSFIDEIEEMGKYGKPIMLGLVNFTFVLYEYNLDIFYRLYDKRLKPILRK